MVSKVQHFVYFPQERARALLHGDNQIIQIKTL